MILHYNQHKKRGSNGFDRDSAAGEAIRRMIAINLKLNLNANDNYALAAA